MDKKDFKISMFHTGAPTYGGSWAPSHGMNDGAKTRHDQAGAIGNMSDTQATMNERLEGEMSGFEKDVKLAVANELKDFWRPLVIAAATIVAAILFGTFTIVNMVSSYKAEATEKLLSEKIVGVEKSLNAKMDAKFDGIEKSLNAKIDGVEKSINAKMDARFDAQQNLLLDIKSRLK